MNPNSLDVNNQNNDSNSLSERILSLQRQIEIHKLVHPQPLYGCGTCGLRFSLMRNGINTHSIMIPPTIPNMNAMNRIYYE